MLLSASSQPATSHCCLLWASYHTDLSCKSSQGCFFAWLESPQVSTGVEELESCWSLLSSSKTKSWGLVLKPWWCSRTCSMGSCCWEGFCACFLPLFQPTLWNLFPGVHFPFFPPRTLPTWQQGRLRKSLLAQPSSVLCHLPAGPHHHHPAVLFE